MRRVGVRALKDHLSEYLKRAQKRLKELNTK